MSVSFNGLTVTPNASGAAFHETQTRTYWGRWATASALPNASGNTLVRQAFTALKPGDFAFVAGDETLYVCTSKGTSGGADAVWVPLAHGERIAADPGTTKTLGNADNGRTFRCANAGGCVVTVPSGLRAGVTATFVQEHATGSVTFVGSGLTLRFAATFSAETREQWAAVVVRVLDTDEALITGVLADA